MRVICPKVGLTRFDTVRNNLPWRPDRRGLRDNQHWGPGKVLLFSKITARYSITNQSSSSSLPHSRLTLRTRQCQAKLKLPSLIIFLLPILSLCIDHRIIATAFYQQRDLVQQCTGTRTVMLVILSISSTSDWSRIKSIMFLLKTLKNHPHWVSFVIIHHRCHPKIRSSSTKLLSAMPHGSRVSTLLSLGSIINDK